MAKTEDRREDNATEDDAAAPVHVDGKTQQELMNEAGNELSTSAAAKAK